LDDVKTKTTKGSNANGSTSGQPSSLDEGIRQLQRVNNGSSSVQGYAQRKRDHKEAKNHTQHSVNRNRGNQSSVSTGPLNDVDIEDNPVEEKKPPEEYIYYFCKSDCPDALYDQVASSRIVTLQDMSSYQHVEPGIKMGCVKSGYGWACVSTHPASNKKVWLSQVCTRMITVDAYRYRDISGDHIEVPSASYQVYEPIYGVVNSMFKMGATMEQSVINAAAAKIYGDLGENQVSHDTFNFYLHMCKRKIVNVLHSHPVGTLVTNNGGLISLDDSFRSNNIYRSTLLIDSHQPLKVLATECSLLYDWDLRTDFDILSIKKVSLNGDARLPFGDRDVSQPLVIFDVTMGKSKTRFDTVFFSLSGLNQDQFISYAPSANNLQHGLKRLLGKRENESMYRRNAILLGAHLAHEMSDARIIQKYSVESVFARLVGSRKLSTDTKQLVDDILCGSVNAFEQSAAYDSQMTQRRSFVAKEVAKVVDGCNRQTIQKFLDFMNTNINWAYYSIYENVLTALAPYLSRQRAAEIVHVKRKLRTAYVNGFKLADEDELMVQSLSAEIKRELAKFKKAPRLFISYGAGSMYSSELPEFVKICINGEFVSHYNGVTMVINIMSKPKTESIPLIFERMYSALSSQDYVYCGIFSDDMVIAGVVNGIPFCNNLDISSNDSSQDVPAFLSLYGAMKNFSSSRALGLIKQCLQPITIRAPEDHTSKLVIKFKGPFEGSGTVLTSSLNHFGSYMIALSSLTYLAEARSEEQINQAFVYGASLVGHVVTNDSCMTNGHLIFGKVQFLKRSPFRANDGKFYSYTNLGCILRGLGRVEDDLDHIKCNVTHAEFLAMTHEQRINLYTSNVIKGWKNEPSNPIMTALRQRFNSSNTEITPDSIKYVAPAEHDLSHMDNTSALFERYGLTTDEITELVQVILHVKVGHQSRTTAVAKILNVDYGVTWA
jgi:hypothetical protein